MEEETHTNRPKGNAIYQQKLKAWKPILTFKDASIFFFVSGIIVLIIGIIIFTSDQNVQEYSVEYTNCINNITGLLCSNITNMASTTCSCFMSLQINNFIQAPVYFYYGMNNYYQNHRQLIKSFDMNQLMDSGPASSSSCSPLYTNSNGSIYAPCGQLANVMFNDSFVLIRNRDNLQVPWTSTNISLGSDRSRYKTPSNWNNTVPPPNWPIPIYKINPKAYVGYEEFLVWMRPAPLPKFRKLHRIFVPSSNFTDGLEAGNYTISISYNYPVSTFGGQKYFIVTNLSWIGGKNSALGILYIVTGIIEIILGIITIIFHFNYSKKLRVNNLEMSSNLIKQDSLSFSTDLDKDNNFVMSTNL